MLARAPQAQNQAKRGRIIAADMSNSQPSISGRAPSVASGRTARSARSARSTNQPRGQFNRRTGNGSAGGSFPSLTLARRKGGDDDDEEDEMVLALKRLVEQRDEEVERLNQQLDSEQRRWVRSMLMCSQLPTHQTCPKLALLDIYSVQQG